jgi:flagellar basal-body rod protein FlgC
MGMFDAFAISGSGMTAERLRMDVIAGNLANANSTRRADGQPGPYLRREVVLQQQGQLAGGIGPTFASFGEFSGATGGGVVATGVVEDSTTPTKLVHDPSNPDADAQGNVRMPNVNPVTEMTDLITATRSYEASTTAMSAIKTEFQRAIDVLR